MNEYTLTDDKLTLIAEFIRNRRMDVYARDKDESDLYTCGYLDCIDEICEIIDM